MRSLPKHQEMPLNATDKAWINEAIRDAQERHGLGKFTGFIKDWGGIGAIAAIVIFALTQWGGYIEFRTHTEDRLSNIETEIESLRSDYGSRIPAALRRLIPSSPRGIGEELLADNLRKAGTILDAAFQTRTPSDPDALQPIRAALQTLRSELEQENEVRAAATADLVRLDGYNQLSAGIAEGRYPSAGSVPQPFSPSQFSGLMNFTINCEYKTARFLEVKPAEFADRVFIFGVTVNRCQQALDNLIWINTEFNSATVRYHGGPLRLANVRFKNCSFDFGSDPNSIFALDMIRRSKGRAVSLLIVPGARQAEPARN